jgi:hypothetical protein
MPSSSSAVPSSSLCTEPTSSDTVIMDECSEIHTIQIFREAKDDDDDHHYHGPHLAPPSTSSCAFTTINDDHLVVDEAASCGCFISSQQQALPLTIISPVAAAMMDGVGDDRAVLDMVVTEDDECDGSAVSTTFTYIDASTNTMAATTTSSSGVTTTLHHNNKVGSSNFYSFFFDDEQQPMTSTARGDVDDEEAIKENMDIVAACNDDDHGGDCDDFSITSQDTQSSPDDWMNLDLDGSVLEDSTLFWEHGLATVEAPEQQQQQSSTSELDVLALPQLYPARQVSVLSLP